MTNSKRIALRNGLAILIAWTVIDGFRFTSQYLRRD